jgi:hypothetical protein
VLEAKLVSPAPRAQGHFGYSLAIDANVAVVGSPSLLGTASGDAFVFRRNGAAWSFDAQLTPATPHRDFGSTVDVSRDVVVVGAPTLIAASGFARVFRFSGTSWVPATTLSSSSSKYGLSVAVHDKTVIVTSPTALVAPSAFVYHEIAPNSWQQTTTITPPFIPQLWGRSIALGDGILAVGAVQTSGLGIAYVDTFDYDAQTSNGFMLAGHLHEDDPISHYKDWFGDSVAIEAATTNSNAMLVAGAPRENFTAKHDGMAHVYTRIGPSWKRVARLTAPDAAQFDEFGSAVALAGGSVLVGAWQNDAPAQDSGAVYSYGLTSVPTLYCTAKVNTLGCTPTISATGSPSASAGSGFVVDCTNTLPDKLGILFYGGGAQIVPFRGGWLCVKAPLQRAAALAASSGSFCDGSYSVDFNAYIASGQDPALVAGTIVHGQWATRDPLDAWGSGLSDALQFLIGP